MQKELEGASVLVFRALARRAAPWTLKRILKSENAREFNGELHGEATFTPNQVGNGERSQSDTQELLYCEEGQTPSPGNGRAGMRWFRKYIWRYADDRLSVWFVKPDGPDASHESLETGDYLFHELSFAQEGADDKLLSSLDAPEPPVVSSSETEVSSHVLVARCSHLCVKDMYCTIYAFRVSSDTPDLLSWASRHVVKGPRKNQDITNFYM